MCVSTLKKRINFEIDFKESIMINLSDDSAKIEFYLLFSVFSGILSFEGYRVSLYSHPQINKVRLRVCCGKFH